MKGTLEAIWEIPKPLSVLQVQMEDGTSIALRRHGNPDGPRLILSHGNGLAIDLYYPFWSLLSREFDVHVHDLRNHGWNETGELEGHTVGAFARDHDQIASAVAGRYGEKPTVGVFHSISALASLHAASKGKNYSALVLYDPPITNTASGARKLESRARETASMLRRRARWFRSQEELSDLHTYLPYFQRSVPGTLELLARTTLRGSTTGQGFELRCPAQFEARIWDHAAEFAASVDFGALSCPVMIVLPDAAAQDLKNPVFDFRKADVCREELPETTHLLPLEKPRECTEALRGFLKNLGIL